MVNFVLKLEQFKGLFHADNRHFDLTTQLLYAIFDSFNHEEVRLCVGKEVSCPDSLFILFSHLKTIDDVSTMRQARIIHNRYSPTDFEVRQAVCKIGRELLNFGALLQRFTRVLQ